MTDAGHCQPTIRYTESALLLRKLHDALLLFAVADAIAASYRQTQDAYRDAVGSQGPGERSERIKVFPTGQ